MLLLQKRMDEAVLEAIRSREELTRAGEAALKSLMTFSAIGSAQLGFPPTLELAVTLAETRRLQAAADAAPAAGTPWDGTLDVARWARWRA